MNKAAQALGRLGGLKKSKAKREAAKRNIEVRWARWRERQAKKETNR